MGTLSRSTFSSLLAPLVLLPASQAGAQTAPPKLVPVRAVQSARDISFLPFDLALEKGFFKAQGLDVTIDYTEGGPTALNALLAGNADVAVLGVGVLFPAIQRGLPVTAVGAISTEDTNVVVVSNSVAQRAGFTPGMPFAERAKMLKGLHIGTNGPGSGDDLATRFLLKQAGLNPDTDTLLVPLHANGPAMVAALKSGTIDAFLFDAVSGREAEAQGIGTIIASFVSGQVPGAANQLHIVVASTKSYADKNQATLIALDRALYRALRYMQQNPVGTGAVAQSLFPALTPALFQSVYSLVKSSFAATPVATDQNVQAVIHYYETASGKTLAFGADRLIDNRAALAATK